MRVKIEECWVQEDEDSFIWVKRVDRGSIRYTSSSVDYFLNAEEAECDLFNSIIADLIHEQIVLHKLADVEWQIESSTTFNMNLDTKDHPSTAFDTNY